MGHLDPNTVAFGHVITNSRLAILPKEDRNTDGSTDSYSRLPPPPKSLLFISETKPNSGAVDGLELTTVLLLRPQSWR